MEMKHFPRIALNFCNSNCSQQAYLSQQMVSISLFITCETEQQKIVSNSGIMIIPTFMFQQNLVSAKYEPILGHTEAVHVKQPTVDLINSGPERSPLVYVHAPL